MTVIQLRVTCPQCGIPTGNLGAHARVCTIPDTALARRLTLLAGTHAADMRTLPEPARFAPPVTDLSMARLMYALESGTPVIRGGSHGWVTPTARNLLNGLLARTVAEGFRTALLAVASLSAGPVRAEVVVPGPLHARSARYRTRPACGESQALRHRLIGGEHIEHVTCEECLDVPLSAVSYSIDE